MDERGATTARGDNMVKVDRRENIYHKIEIVCGLIKRKVTRLER